MHSCLVMKRSGRLAKFRRPPMQGASMRRFDSLPAVLPQVHHQRTIPLVPFYLWSGVANGLETSSKIGRWPLRLRAYYQAQKVQCRLREFTTKVCLMEPMNQVVGMCDRLKPRAKQFQCLWKRVLCCDTQTTET